MTRQERLAGSKMSAEDPSPVRFIPMAKTRPSPRTRAWTANPIEGGPSTSYARTKAFIYAQPAAWHTLCARFASVITDYLRAQIEAGAQAIQIFDSWAGQLSRADYREFAFPHTKSIFDALAGTGVPTLHFGVGTLAILPEVPWL